MNGKSVIITPGPKDLAKVLGYNSTSRYFSRSEGKEFINYECIYCKYSTIYLEKMKKHQAEGEHPWGFGGQPTEVEEGSAEPTY